MHNSISNISITFNGKDFSGDTGALFFLNFIEANDLHAPSYGLPCIDPGARFSLHNSNDSLLAQTVLHFTLRYFSQKDQEVM